MKPFLLCLLLASGPASAQKPGFLSLDNKFGFRDLKFGADTSELSGRRFVMRGNEMTYYVRPADSPFIGSCEAHIMYGFFKGKLMNITLTSIGMGSGKALLYALQYVYGVPEKKLPYLERYTWDGYQVFITLNMPDGNQSEAVIASRAMAYQIEAENTVKAKKPTNTL